MKNVRLVGLGGTVAQYCICIGIYRYRYRYMDKYEALQLLHFNRPSIFPRLSIRIDIWILPSDTETSAATYIRIYLFETIFTLKH